MAEVAKRAGVHVTTVSLALRNHPSLPESTRERIRTLARDMGYQQDPALQALIAYRRKSRPRQDVAPLAYITNFASRLAWKNVRAHGDFFAGAEAKARELGYGLEHFWLGEPNLTHERLSDILVARGISGLVFASQRRDGGIELRFDWSRFSAVKIDFHPPEPVLHNVTNDQRAIIRLAMRRALGAGCRRIGFVLRHDWDECVDQAWSSGFLSAQQAVPPADRVPALYTPPPTGPETDLAVPRDLFEEWFREQRPDVVISFGPFVRPHFAAMGLRVPRDVAFVDILLDSPDGTTAGVRQNCRRVGEVAVEILAGQLQHHAFGVPEFPTSTLVEGTWFDGRSLPSRRDADAAAVLSA
jgi:LacI family transcriptional regulator